jgi:HK97 family phage prohead protease
VNEEILTRSDATLADVDMKQRLIDIIAVPWEQEAEVFWRGEQWKEVFSRGAFDGLENSAGRIRVNREHTKGDTVGRVVSADPYDPRGLILRTKIAKTLRGDETLALAEDDMISGSVGYFVKQASDVALDKRIKLRRVNRGFLEHFSYVESPAYTGAQVLAVREESQRLPADQPLISTPSLDEVLEDDVIAWARMRLGK